MKAPAMTDFNLCRLTNKAINTNVNALPDYLDDLISRHLSNSTTVHRKRLYDPATTLKLFINQVLRSSTSCMNTVQCYALQQHLLRARSISLNTGAYTKARQRLDESFINNVTRDFSQHVENHQPLPLWHGYHLKLVDGTTVSMPDTKDNQASYPQQAVQQDGLGFPILRLVAIISMFTGAVLNYRLAPYQGKGTGEISLFRSMLNTINKDDLVIADRLYPSYQMLATLMQKGAKFISKQHRQHKYNFEHGRYISKYDRIITWHKPVVKGRLSAEEHNALPERIEVRMFKVGNEVYVTNLMDEKPFTRKKLVSLYRKRWNVELDLRNIKQVMGMDILKCKSPSMIRKEIAVTMLAYNLICFYIMSASKFMSVSRRNMSFTNAKNAVERLIELATSTKEYTLKTHQFVIHSISAIKVGIRRKRPEPRVLKRRPKPYPLMKYPRNIARKKLKWA